MLKYFTLVVLLSMILVGCGEKNESSGDKKETVKEESDKPKAPENQTEVQKKEEANSQTKEETEKINELGMTPGLPSTFPADVPQPKNAKTLGSLNSSEGTVVTFESTDKVADIVSYYKDEMKKNGYSIIEGGETMISDKGGLINWKKDKNEVGIMLGYDKDKNITSLVITYK